MLSVHLFKLKDADVQAFLEEATALDPRFKSKLDRDEIGSGKQQWQQTQRQLQMRYFNLTIPLIVAHFYCETFLSGSVALTW